MVMAMAMAELRKKGRRSLLITLLVFLDILFSSNWIKFTLAYLLSSAALDHVSTTVEVAAGPSRIRAQRAPARR
jgi:hypothetical protein